MVGLPDEQPDARQHPELSVILSDYVEWLVRQLPPRLRLIGSNLLGFGMQEGHRARSSTAKFLRVRRHRVDYCRNKLRFLIKKDR
jgi:hypothetical protein